MSLILVTGGAGFIGSHVVPMLLAVGHAVRVLDCLSPQVHGPVPLSSGLEFLSAPNVEFIRGSVCDERDVRNALEGADAVVHLAAETGTAQSMYQIAHYNDVNVMGLARLLDVLANDSQKTVGRVVLASSRAVYGEGAYECTKCSPGARRYPLGRSAAQLVSGEWNHRCDDCREYLSPLATNESDATNPASIYAATKLNQEHLVSIACDAMGLEHATLRLQNVFGEGQSLKNPYTGILSIFSTRIRRGQILPIYEDGEETRDFVHVELVARALVAAATAKKLSHSVFNVGSGLRTSVADVAGVLCDVLGAARKLQITGQYRIGDIRHNFADTSRLVNLLGPTHQIDLADGLTRFSDWVMTQALSEDGLERANLELQARKLMG